MRRRTISFIIVMLLVSSFALFASATGKDSNSNLDDKQNEQVKFLIKAFKRSSTQPSEESGAPNPGQDGDINIKVFDSLSTRLGSESKLSGSVKLTPVNMNPFLDEFFTTGIHVAMVSVSSSTGYGSRQQAKSLPKAEGGGKYSPHSTTVTIKASPMKVVSTDKDGNVTDAADSDPAFFKGTKAFPVQVYFKTSKLTALDAHNCSIVQEKDQNIWKGYTIRQTIKGKDVVPQEYCAYSLESSMVSASSGVPASLTLTFTNRTERQEAIIKEGKSATYAWTGIKGNTSKVVRSNVAWTAENQLWVKGDRKAFDALPAGSYKMLIRIEMEAK